MSPKLFNINCQLLFWFWIVSDGLNGPRENSNLTLTTSRLVWFVFILCGGGPPQLKLTSMDLGHLKFCYRNYRFTKGSTLSMNIVLLSLTRYPHFLRLQSTCLQEGTTNAHYTLYSVGFQDSKTHSSWLSRVMEE